MKIETHGVLYTNRLRGHCATCQCVAIPEPGECTIEFGAVVARCPECREKMRVDLEPMPALVEGSKKGKQNAGR